MGMVFLKLLGYAIGSVLMYWGIVLVLLGPVMVVVLLIVLVNQVWNKITGKDEEWKWFLDWFDAFMQMINRCKFEWLGWLPGILIQGWYAGYAANLVQSSISDASLAYAIAIHGMGVIGMGVAVGVFYGLYNQVVEVKMNQWIYVLVGTISFSAYGVLLQQPETAALLSESWERVFAAFLVAAI